MTRPLTVHAAILAAAAADPRRVAIRQGPAQVTYGELDATSAALAAGLRREGARPGDRVGVRLPNVPAYYAAVVGISRAGMTVVPVPFRATEREVEQVRAHSGMRLLLEAEDVERLARAAPDGVEDAAREDTAFFVAYTSGTTGRPKGAVVSQRARTLNMLVLGQEYGCYTADDCHLITTPLYHGAGLTRGLAPLAFGGSVQLMERFDAEEAVRHIATGAVTATFVVPTILAALLDVPAASPGRLRVIMSNAAALPEHLKAPTLERWPAAGLFEIYGSTEAGTVTSLRPVDQARKKRCVGRPLALTEVRIEGDGVGVLWSRSPLQFDGYLDDPEATARALRGGWVTAGDLARIDEEGYVYIVGRESDVIITGGVNVYPREVEEVLAEHPGVREAAVVGVPDERWGERVHAVLVRAPGTDLDVAEVERHARTQLAPAKVPKTYEVREALPRTATGKVVKRELTGRRDTAS